MIGNVVMTDSTGFFFTGPRDATTAFCGSGALFAFFSDKLERLLNVLNLFAHLLNEHFQINGQSCGISVGGLGA